MPDTPALFAADPVFMVGGQRNGDLARDCLNVVVEEDTRGLRRCIAQFVAIAPREQGSGDVVEYLDGRAVDFGSQLTVSLGPPDAEEVVFSGKVSALEVTFDEGDTPHVSVYAEDALMDLRMTRRSRTYRQVSDADIARSIASEHGLTPQIDASGPTYPFVQQLDESDLGFLRARADLIGAELWAAGTTLHFATRDHRSGPSLTLTQGRDLLTLSARADLSHQRSSVKVSGYDARSRQTIDVRVDDAVVRAEVSGGRLGTEVLATAFGTRDDQWSVLVPAQDSEARSWSEAAMKSRARRFVTVTGTTAGSPRVAVGAQLTLRNVGGPFEGGGYYVTRCRQRWQRGAGGLRTTFDAERATVTAGGAR